VSREGKTHAHQVPDSVDCAVTYGPAVQPVLGVDIESLSSNELKAVVAAIDRIKRVSECIEEDNETGHSQEESKPPSLNEKRKQSKSCEAPALRCTTQSTREVNLRNCVPRMRNSRMT